MTEIGKKGGPPGVCRAARDDFRRRDNEYGAEIDNGQMDALQ